MSPFSLAGFRRRKNTPSSKKLARSSGLMRPGLEALENRLAPAVLSVVGTGGDGTTRFNTFAQAYGASTSSSDVIQIEPSAGDAGSIDLNNASKARTVRGDMNFMNATGIEALDNVTIEVNSVRLDHLYVNGTVSIIAGIKSASVHDVQLNNLTETAGNDNGGNTLSFDTIRGSVTLQGGTTTFRASSGDQILDCDFTSGANLNIGSAGAAASGVTVMNTLWDPSLTTGLTITDSQNIVLDNVKITLTTGVDAVVINNSVTTLPLTGLEFRRDDIRTQGGTAIHVILTTGGVQLGLLTEGTAFQANKFAISLDGVTDLLAGSYIDAGGGAGGSMGGNEFHLNMTAAVSDNDPGITGNHLTISVSNDAVEPGVSRVIGPTGTVVPTGATDLSQAQAFVQGLYHAYLTHTAGVDELNSWVNVLNSSDRATVSFAISHSQEAYTERVQRLYDQLLGRQADQPGTQGLVNALQNGATLEQVTAALLGSGEFANRANALEGTPGSDPNVNFVRALYEKLLSRNNEPPNEQNGWVNVAQTQGRAQVALDFLASTEFRHYFVESLYTDYTRFSQNSLLGVSPDLLCRSTAPSQSEVDGWANSGLGILNIAAAISASPEFFSDR